MAQCFRNVPRYFVRTDLAGDEEFSTLGMTDEGRFLLVAIDQLEGSEWRLITAYFLNSKRGRRLYEAE